LAFKSRITFLGSRIFGRYKIVELDAKRQFVNLAAVGQREIELADLNGFGFARCASLDPITSLLLVALAIRLQR
jgi:hypothetical protein